MNSKVCILMVAVGLMVVSQSQAQDPFYDSIGDMFANYWKSQMQQLEDQKQVAEKFLEKAGEYKKEIKTVRDGAMDYSAKAVGRIMQIKKMTEELSKKMIKTFNDVMKAIDN